MDFPVQTRRVLAPWKLLLVDDEPAVHEVTRLVLGGFRFDDRPLDILSAHSAAEGRALLAEHDDIALILLDVVMETDQAGLDLVRHVREELGNDDVRIVLRTGQPGQAPEHEVIARYDINDYKEKTELTAQKLSTTIYAALRAWRDIQAIRAGTRGLERVIDASAEVFAHERPGDFADVVLAQLADLLGGHRGVLYVAPRPGAAPDPESLPVAGAIGRFARLDGRELGDALPAHMVATVRAALAEGGHRFEADHFVLLFSDRRDGGRLVVVGEGLGMTEMDVRLLEVFATNVAIAFENLQLNQELSAAQMEMIWLLAGAAETRSHETAAHVRRVGLIAELLGRAHGLGEAECERLRHAAPMHDLGKIGIPDAILNKPGAHTAEEAEVMRQHAEIGHRMLAASRHATLQLAAEIALTHHECWDGTGYPRGLAGEDIPLSGRITMLADVFDALGSRRCYKEPWPREQIREHILERRGRMFDPALVDLLVAHWERAEAVREEHPD